MNTVIIREDDLIETIADALQYISYFHPMDYIRALGAAYEREVSPAAKDAMAQILSNSRMCAEGQRPICRTPASSPSSSNGAWTAASTARAVCNRWSTRACARPTSIPKT